MGKNQYHIEEFFRTASLEERSEAFQEILFELIKMCELENRSINVEQN